MAAGHKTRATASTAGVEAVDQCPGDLGTAIVHRACVDYLMVLRGRTNQSKFPLESREKIEEFFRSRWFCFLCDADGELILEALQQMNKRGQKTIYFTSHPDERKGINSNDKKHRFDLD